MLLKDPLSFKETAEGLELSSRSVSDSDRISINKQHTAGSVEA